MRKAHWIARKFWLNAGLSLSVAGMPWTATMGLLGTSTIATLTPTAAQAAMLNSWEFDPATQELKVAVPAGTTPRYFLAAEPARIVVDLPDTQVGAVPLQQTYDGAIREIRVAQFEPGVARIVLELAPGTVLAPGHVELQQVAGTGGGENRWVLRPLLATNASVAMAAPTDSTTPDTASAVELPPLEPGATEIPVQPPLDAAATLPPSNTTVAPAPAIGTGTEASAMATLPAPDAPVPAPTASTANAPQVTVPALPTSEGDSLESSDAPVNSETDAVRSDEANPFENAHSPFVSRTETVRRVVGDGSENNPEESPEDSSQDNEDTDQSPTEQNAETDNIREQDTANQDSSMKEESSTPAAVASLPVLPESSSPVPPPSEAVSVPPLTAPQIDTETQASPPPLTPTLPQSAAQSVPTAAAPTSTGAIEFGQPLPKSANLSTTTPGSMGAYSSNAVLLPSGTTLNVRYTGEEPLELVAGEPRQEVLVLAEAVSDASGNVVLPEGSYVMGRFETSEEGSQFIAQAVSLEGQSLILHAQSDPLSGQRPSQGELLRNSGLGVAAGVVLGLTGVGLIPALAAGAATAAGITFLPEGRSNVVHPDQVLEVRLTQDLTSVN